MSSNENKPGLLGRFKRLIPNSIKQEGKYLLMDMLKIPYTRTGVPLEIIEWLPKDKPITFFDIGASIGGFSGSVCNEYQIKKGILVEPVSKLIPGLERDFSDKAKFRIVNSAIAESEKETDFYVNEEADFVSSMLKIHNEEFASLNFKEPVLTKIKTLTLDKLAEQEGLLGKDEQPLNIDLIKIDVQGAEHLVLLGSAETLKRTKLVYIEFSYKPLYEQSSTFFDLYKIFYENNFILVNTTRGYVSPNGELLQGDALFVNKNFTH